MLILATTFRGSLPDGGETKKKAVKKQLRTTIVIYTRLANKLMISGIITLVILLFHQTVCGSIQPSMIYLVWEEDVYGKDRNGCLSNYEMEE